MANFPPHLENRSTDFDETSNLELPPEDHRASKTTFRCVNVGDLGEHPVCHCKLLSLPFFLLFLISSARAQVDFPSRYQIWRKMFINAEIMAQNQNQTWQPSAMYDFLDHHTGPPTKSFDWSISACQILS